MNTTKRLNKTKTSSIKNVTYDDINVFEAVLRRLIEHEKKYFNRRNLLYQYKGILKMLDTLNKPNICFYATPYSYVYKGMYIGDIKRLKDKVSILMVTFMLEESSVLIHEQKHSQVKARYFYDNVAEILDRYICNASFEYIQIDEFLKMIDEIDEYVRCEKERISELVVSQKLIVRKHINKNILEVIELAEKSISFARDNIMQLLNFELLRKEWEYVSTKK